MKATLTLGQDEIIEAIKEYLAFRGWHADEVTLSAEEARDHTDRPTGGHAITATVNVRPNGGQHD